MFGNYEIKQKVCQMLSKHFDPGLRIRIRVFWSFLDHYIERTVIQIQIFEMENANVPPPSHLKCPLPLLLADSLNFI